MIPQPPGGFDQCYGCNGRHHPRDQRQRNRSGEYSLSQKICERFPPSATNHDIFVGVKSSPPPLGSFRVVIRGARVVFSPEGRRSSCRVPPCAHPLSPRSATHLFCSCPSIQGHSHHVVLSPSCRHSKKNCHFLHKATAGRPLCSKTKSR